MKSNRYAYTSFVIALLMSLYMIYIMIQIPVTPIENIENFTPVNYKAIKLSTGDFLFLILALAGIAMSCLSYYKKEPKKWINFIGLLLNAVWFSLFFWIFLKTF